jgi:hypothetical protein
MSTTLDYLIPDLRFRIGDIDPTAYRYLDSWLLVALDFAVKKYYRYYKPPKYLIDALGNVTRNSNSPRFCTDETTEGTIEKTDEPILVLLAAIATLGGSLENSAWSIVSWRDAEVSYNNNESGRLRSSLLDAMNKELNDMILAPTKKLAQAGKQSLPGYLGNDFEHTGDY